MKYNMKEPCANCPFHSDKLFPLSPERVREIVYGNGEFACHKTVDYSGDSDGDVTAKSEHCAGLLIMLEHMEMPHQMMRIAERFGKYDRSKLNMEAPVYHDVEDYIGALEDSEL